MKKVALLVCDRVGEELAVEYGDYPEMFSDLLSDYQLVPYFALDGLLPANVMDYDAYICTGSRFSVYDNEDWIEQLKDFIRQIKRVNRTFVGVCFGHQLLAEALGGKVEQSEKGWCIGVHTFEIVKNTDWMEPYQADINLLMMCQDQVIRLPEEANVLGRSPKCEIGLFTVGENMLGIQAHPEFSIDYNRTLMQRRIDRMGEELVQAGLKSLEKPVERTLIAQWIRSFID